VNDHELAKEAYQFEIDRKERIENGINLPINIITAIAVATVYLISQARGEDFFLEFWILAFCCLTLIFIVFSASCIVLGYISEKTAYIDHPDVIAKHRNDLLTYYQQEGEAKFQEFLSQRYIQIASLNGQRNDRKSGRFFYAKILLVLGMVSFLASIMLYVANLIDWKTVNVWG
jgi:hypothetical protein